MPVAPPACRIPHVVVLVWLAVGCAGGKDGHGSRSGRDGEEPFGSTAYEQNLDAMLAEQGTGDVQVLVRLTVPETASQLHDLLTADGSPAIVSFSAIGATDAATITIGTTPFTGEMSNDALNDAVMSSSAAGMGGELRQQVEQAVSDGDAFLVQSFVGFGKADDIRAWWHANSTRIQAVVVGSE